MRTIILYIRSCFCSHEWEREKVWMKHYSDWVTTKEGNRISATCTKCGWHRSYWEV